MKVIFETEKEALGLLGASGSGKSMTLRCIAGLVKPDEGRIELNGITLFDSKRGIDLPPQKRGVGFLFQNYAIFPNMTVMQNVMMGLKRSGLPIKLRRERAENMMQRLKLEQLYRCQSHQLSGGQQQRVALARILVSEPQILMLDEPFSALDSYLRWQVASEVIGILEDFQGPSLLVSHNRDEIYQICSQIAVYKNGSIDNFGSRRELFHNPRTCTTALLTGCKNIETVHIIASNCVYVPAWNLTFNLSSPAPQNMKAIGIRAHFFNQGQGENAFICKIQQVIEEPFEVMIFVLPDGAQKSICWVTDKQTYQGLTEKRFWLSLNANDILLLRD